MTKENDKSQSGKTIAWLLLVLLLGMTIAARAQESPTPEPTSAPPTRNIRISFLPPPLDGTISLGIYDAKGKLVRVLHREADLNEFKIGADALSTMWNGKDDGGESVPAGKYSAHGFVVGGLKTEGVGFFFNDWITSEDSPRISRIRSLGMRDDKLLLGVELVPQGPGHVLYDFEQKTIKLSDDDSPDSAASAAPSDGPAENIDPVVMVPGRNGTRWVIDRTAKGAPTTEVKQYSPSGEFLRRLTAAPDQPQPAAMAASMADDKIYLLEENSRAQRVRGLTLVAAKVEGEQRPVSDWRVDFEKWIVAHKDFSLVDGKPVPSPEGGTDGPEKLKLKLQPNPLLNDDRVTVELAIGFDADGSFLKTTDGLPLFSISETPGVTRGLLAGRGPKTIDVFQDDGAVVEQFRVTGVDQMMSFDCGGFELK
ncbi:MAG TPA: hypothetical protein VNP98_03255 [Chthoniobacterales bacterium]|nr:hypothetical protein [Chthoniobacterales bacterium]